MPLFSIFVAFFVGRHLNCINSACVSCKCGAKSLLAIVFTVAVLIVVVIRSQSALFLKLAFGDFFPLCRVCGW